MMCVTSEFPLDIKKPIVLTVIIDTLTHGIKFTLKRVVDHEKCFVVRMILFESKDPISVLILYKIQFLITLVI